MNYRNLAIVFVLLFGQTVEAPHPPNLRGWRLRRQPGVLAAC